MMFEFISNNFETFLTIATLLTVLLNVFNHWYISKGNMRYVYILSMIVYMGYITVETSLAFRHPEQWSIMFYNITNVWALSMAVKGHIRLNKYKPGEKSTG